MAIGEIIIYNFLKDAVATGAIFLLACKSRMHVRRPIFGYVSEAELTTSTDPTELFPP